MTTATTPALSFTEVEKPATVSNRQSEPNPFADVFPSDDKALAVTIDGPGDSDAAKKLIRQARNAATAKDRTARVKLDTQESGTGKNKKTQTTLTFWTVQKIKRERKS